MSDSANEFEKQAAQKRRGMLRELIGFIATNKRWWLIPLVVALVIASALVLLGGTGAAPFIYTLF
ncbi:MAG: hypothetical protein H6707_17950 [Deltaproteobacteria bacterium]|nr:hypothetical protein [Deltaproteobacteria bacterium]